MAKGDREQAQQNINTERERVDDRYSSFTDEQTQRRRDYAAQSDAERQALLNSQRGVSQDPLGGLNADSVNTIRGLYNRPGSASATTSSGSST